MNRKKLFTFLQYALFLMLGAGLIWWQFRGMKPEEKAIFTKSLHDANYWVVIPVIGLALLGYWARSQRWRILIEPMGYLPKTSNTFCGVMVGYLVNSFVPRVGEVVRCTIITRYEKIPVDKLIGTVVTERIFDLVCYATLIGVTVATQLRTVKRFLSEKFSGQFHSFDWTKTWVISAIVVLSVFLLTRILKRIKSNKIINRIKKVLSNLKEGITSINHLKHKKAFIFYTLLMWGMYIVEIYLGFYAMEATTGLGFGTACAVLTLASLAMILLPGGMGLFPSFIANVLLMYHVKIGSGIAFGWLMWGVSTSINLIIGFICLLIIPSLNRNYHPVETNLSYPE